LYLFVPGVGFIFWADTIVDYKSYFYPALIHSLFKRDLG
jgi:hypothetical protein